MLKRTVRLKFLLIGHGPVTIQQPESVKFCDMVVPVHNSQPIGRVKPMASWYMSPAALRKPGERSRYK